MVEGLLRRTLRKRWKLGKTCAGVNEIRSVALRSRTEAPAVSLMAVDRPSMARTCTFLSSCAIAALHERPDQTGVAAVADRERGAAQGTLPFGSRRSPGRCAFWRALRKVETAAAVARPTRLVPPAWAGLANGSGRVGLASKHGPLLG